MSGKEEFTIKIKIKGDVNVGVPTPPPPLPPQNNFQIGNSLNGSTSHAEPEVMPGWGIEHHTTTNNQVEDKAEEKKTTEKETKEVDEKPVDKPADKPVDKPENNQPKVEDKPAEDPKTEKKEPPVDKTVPDEKYRPLPHKIPKGEEPFEIPKDKKEPVTEKPTEENVEEVPTKEVPVTDAPTEENKAEKVDTKPRELTAKEIKEARTNGSDVAKLLIGYTNDSEERLVADIINEKVNPDNVMEFIKGYTDNSSGGNYLFEQLESEYRFEEAQNLMKKLATDASEYYKAHQDFTKARDIDIVLQENGFSEDKAITLDKLTKPE